MHKLLKALREGYVITLREDFGQIAVRVSDKEDHHAQRLIYEREIIMANFDVLRYSVDECIEMIRDMNKGGGEYQRR